MRWDSTSTRPGKPAVCSWCGQGLSALRAMRRDVCERPTCLQRHDEQLLRSARAEVAAALRQQQVARLGSTRAHGLRVAWIRPHEARLVELPAQARGEQVGFLERLAAGDGAESTAPAEAATQAGAVGRAEAQLCGWCGGRCCRYGGANHAYIDATHLRRWQKSMAGSTLADAARAYAERLPDRHVEGSCPYHGERGCTLDREMRSEVCNRHACEGLRAVQLRSARAPQDEWLFVMGARAELANAVLATQAAVIPFDPATAP